MTFNALIVAFGLIALLLLIAAWRNIRRRRLLGGMVQGTASLVFILIALGALTVAANLRTFQRLTAEQAAGELQLTRVGYHQFNGTFTFPSGERTDFALRGDEWEIDAHLLKWRGLATWLGFDTVYRLDRISGRYTNIADEQSLPRTVFSLVSPERIDLWELTHRYHDWLPWIDALYGSATFLPMADGALYDIRVSDSGLVARPLNQAARSAVTGWH